MKDSQDFNHVSVDAINESIVVIEEFPDRLVFSFRHHASESGKVRQLFNSKDYSFDEATGINFRVFSDVTV